MSFALAPGLAEARVGGGTSSGSRGSNTNSAPPTTNTAPTAAQPMQRTVTPNAPAAAPHAPAAQPMAPRSSFASGLMGGLIGAGIGGLLFGGGFLGGGMGGIGFLGLLLQIGLVVGLGYLLVRLFMGARKPATAMAGGPAMFSPGQQPAQPPMMGGGGSAGGMPAVTPLNIAASDFQQFEQLLKDIQVAWSTHDPNGLRALTTPEMFSYFGEQIAAQVSRGLRNQVTGVVLESGDLSEAWVEQGREYATVAMRFSMIDCTRDTGGRVVEGSATARDTATEIWTFVRPRAGNWVLSAIQQTR